SSFRLRCRKWKKSTKQRRSSDERLRVYITIRDRVFSMSFPFPRVETECPIPPATRVQRSCRRHPHVREHVHHAVRSATPSGFALFPECASSTSFATDNRCAKRMPN